MNTKAKEIQVFFDEFEKNLAKQIHFNSVNNRFVIDLIKSECKKARHAFNLLTWLAQESDFDELHTHLRRLRKKPTNLFFHLLNNEQNTLDNLKEKYQQKKIGMSDFCSSITFPTGLFSIYATVLYAGGLSLSPIFYPVISIAILGLAAMLISMGMMLFYFAVIKNIEQASKQIKDHNFTKTYQDYIEENNIQQTITGIKVIEEDAEEMKISLSTNTRSSSFFKNKEKNGLNALFTSIDNSFTQLNNPPL